MPSPANHVRRASLGQLISKCIVSEPPARTPGSLFPAHRPRHCTMALKEFTFEEVEKVGRSPLL